MVFYHAVPARLAVRASVAALMMAALAMPGSAAEAEGDSGWSTVKEVGLDPVKVGAGPFQFDTAEQHDIRVDIVARGLAHGYSLTFLPNGDALVVERGARLRVIRNATGAKPDLVAAPIAGVPDFSKTEHNPSEDMLGIQDVALHPDFAKNGLIYYTYNRPMGYDAAARRVPVATVLARATLKDMKLTGAKDLIVGEAMVGHGGSRIAFGKDDDVYISLGGLDAGDIGASQRTDNIYGKVLRIKADGSIPADNPFVKTKGARPEIFSFGHRDPLGITVEPVSGSIIASEHGPQGGDELNHIQSGRNYGWPKFTYGNQYGGSPLPTAPVGPGTESPLMIWMPGIAPSGIAFYTGDRFPEWKNNLFIASARRGEINGTGGLIRVVFNDKLQDLRQEVLLGDLRQRFKDVRQGPDGLLYALTDEDNSVLVRISPAPHQKR
jgi:glucose/arabinose dehydrogenase